uniref:Uncharacterized protein n=1 Tax=Anguilla anguilla TaxID=7936 RepID=A0A0E9UKZ0_ANGAN
MKSKPKCTSKYSVTMFKHLFTVSGHFDQKAFLYDYRNAL